MNDKKGQNILDLKRQLMLTQKQRVISARIGNIKWESLGCVRLMSNKAIQIVNEITKYKIKEKIK